MDYIDESTGLLPVCGNCLGELIPSQGQSMHCANLGRKAKVTIHCKNRKDHMTMFDNSGL